MYAIHLTYFQNPPKSQILNLPIIDEKGKERKNYLTQSDAMGRVDGEDEKDEGNLREMQNQRV